jgi:protein-export SecD/SecF family membrane protein
MARKSYGKAVRTKKGRKSTFFILSAIVILAVLTCIYGVVLPTPDGKHVPIYGARDMRFGIDIRGGVEAVYVPADYDGKPTEDQLSSIRSIMESRLDNLGILDRDVIIDSTNGRVVVRFPWKSDDSAFDPDTAMRELGETALLTFKDPSGTVLLTGADVESARAGVDPQSGNNIVLLKLKPEGATKFAEATGALVGQQISINMDDQMISNPQVVTQITGGEASITGMSGPEEAVELADKINAGALPFAISAISSSTISPQLGSNALEVMLKAGAIAFALLCLIMLGRYRLNGFVACISLTAQVVGILLAISIPQQTLTLQGIAGIILSIGLGVDANVIISERIQEELINGNIVRNAVEIGFDRAFSSVLDGNVTVAIAAACLIIFGSGSMLSFGYSLLVGVILNLICGATLSHHLTRSLIQFDGLRKTTFFVAKRRMG